VRHRLSEVLRLHAPVTHGGEHAFERGLLEGDLTRSYSPGQGVAYIHEVDVDLALSCEPGHQETVVQASEAAGRADDNGTRIVAPSQYGTPRG